MKILFTIGQLSNGGAERVVSILASEFSTRHEVEIVTLISPERVYNIPETVKYTFVDSKTSNRVIRIIRRYKGLKKEINTFLPDIIISFTTEINIYSILARNHKKTPLIISERNDPYNDPPSRITRKIRDAVYKWADGYVFQTEDARDYFKDLITGDQIVIPNPVKQDLPNALITSKEKKIVTVSRLYPQKNIELLIDAFSEVKKLHPEYKLEIYGDGPLRNNLEDRVNSLQLSRDITFEGFCNNVHSRIANASIFCLVSDYEGMSNAMLEALAMGLPTICTDCPIGGAKMLIRDHENGILIPVGDKDKLVDSINQLIENTELGCNLGERAIKLKDELAPNVIANKWIGFINEIVRKNGKTY